LIESTDSNTSIETGIAAHSDAFEAGLIPRSLASRGVAARASPRDDPSSRTNQAVLKSNSYLAMESLGCVLGLNGPRWTT
jgi:hypothetical protein